MQTILHEFRYALRQLRRSPGFALVAVLTLALGIAAVTTVFTWANAILFDPWPQVRDTHQLRFFAARIDAGGGYSLNYEEYQYLRDHSRSFQQFTAHELVAVDLADPGARPERYWTGLIASNYFEILGVKPQLGRLFVPGDDRAYGSAPEVVLSDALWRSRYHADPAIVGQTIQVNRHPLTVVGIAPQGFAGIYGGMEQLLWVPLSTLPELFAGAPDPLLKGHFGLQVAGRLNPGVTDQQAAAEVHGLAHQFAAQHNTTYYNGWDLNFDNSAHMSRGIYGDIAEQMPLQFCAAALQLLLVCVNVAGLLIQRGSRRAREIAIRTSLGATRGRLLRQMLVETTVLATVAALLGSVFSLLMARALYVLLPNFGIALTFNLHPDLRVLLFSIGVTAVVVLLCWILPARQMLNVSQVQALHEGGLSMVGSAGGQRRRAALLSAQLAICFVVLVTCALLVRTLWNVVHHDPGFATEGALAASLNLSRAGYSEAKGFVFQRALLDKLRAIPGVESASLTSYVPMGSSGGGNVRDVAIDGYSPTKNESMSVVTDSAGPGFFHALRIPVLQGREFSEGDSAEAPCVAVVNQSMVRKYWPAGNAVGGHVHVSKRTCEVVGVVHNIVYRSVAWESGDPVLYLSLLQDYQPWFNVVLRSWGSAYAVLPGLQQAVESLDSTLPLTDVESLNEHIQVSYASQKIPAEMMAVYAICCLLIAVVGIYAAMEYSVVQRNREFALRIAVGANRSDVLGLVLRGSMQVAIAGLLAGAIGAFFAVKIMKGMLYGVSAFDPLSAVAAAALVLLTAVGAAWLPARKAASIEPMQALRTE
jgi:putative ABC transport system permease protein